MLRHMKVNNYTKFLADNLKTKAFGPFKPIGIRVQKIKQSQHPRKMIMNTIQETKQLLGYAALSYPRNINDYVSLLLTLHNITTSS